MILIYSLLITLVFLAIGFAASPSRGHHLGYEKKPGDKAITWIYKLNKY